MHRKYTEIGQSIMKKQYYLDLEKFSLKKFEDTLRKRDMIPSRVILKEKMEERFKILDSFGIDSLKTLVDLLKTKQKIEDSPKNPSILISIYCSLGERVGFIDFLLPKHPIFKSVSVITI